MASKKRKESSSGVIQVILSILLILVILFALYQWDKHEREKLSPARIEEKVPKNKEEAYEVLEEARKRRDFLYPGALSPSHQSLELVEHTYFSLGYHEEHEQPAWVAYVISRVHTQNNSERRNNFREDPGVSSGSASPKDYSRTGYDRGHLAPAADFDFAKKSLSETFFMSNISPQDPSLNRGGWNELEGLVRSWATEKDSLWVVCGPILEGRLKKIGHNRVSVPKYFYKIILDVRSPSISMIGFLMPNQKITKGLGNFVVSIDSIEMVSGLDFFPQIPDVLEDALEKEVPREAWFKMQKR